jgi:hypothetical protein
LLSNSDFLYLSMYKELPQGRRALCVGSSSTTVTYSICVLMVPRAVLPCSNRVLIVPRADFPCPTCALLVSAQSFHTVGLSDLMFLPRVFSRLIRGLVLSRAVLPCSICVPIAPHADLPCSICALLLSYADDSHFICAVFCFLPWVCSQLNPRPAACSRGSFLNFNPRPVAYPRGTSMLAPHSVCFPRRLFSLNLRDLPAQVFHITPAREGVAVGCWHKSFSLIYALPAANHLQFLNSQFSVTVFTLAPDHVFVTPTLHIGSFP